MSRYMRRGRASDDSKMQRVFVHIMDVADTVMTLFLLIMKKGRRAEMPWSV